jgi:hypothetical protein
MMAPDEAVVTCAGNGHISTDRFGEMTLLRCADVTLQSGRILAYRSRQKSASPDQRGGS